MIIRKALPQDLRPSAEISAICFEYGIDPLPVPAPEPVPDREGVSRYVALTDDGSDMMGTVTVTEFPVFFDGSICRMGGVGGVATLPQYRRQGCIRGCFDLALQDMYEKGHVLSYLYPFSTAYYRQFGYESFLERNIITQKLNTLQPQKTSGRLELVRQGHPMTEEIRSIDLAWETRYNLMVRHSEPYYKWTQQENPPVRKEYTYVYLAADGTPKAYTTFRKEDTPAGRIHRCSRFVFTDREGFHGLMGLFKSFSSDHASVEYILPGEPGLLYLPRELALGSVEIQRQMLGSVRVIQVKTALELARYRGSGSAVLQILDPQLPQNNKIFAVTFENGHAIRVEETHEEADAVLTIAAFSTLLLGAADFEDALRTFDGIEIRNPETLPQIFFRKNAYLVDFF